MSRHIFLLLIVTFLTGVAAIAQTGSEPATDVAYWVAHWSQPPTIVFGSDEEAFYQNIKIVLFPYNDHDEPANPSALESNIQWLKDHPNVRFYVDGYASSRGDWVYNLKLSQRRAEWVKQQLVSKALRKAALK
jgi:outer membrane protein OmpA-like peptidoglycan-associated protein